MADLKDDQTALTAEQLLEARVDAMMDPHPKVEAVPISRKPPLNIVDDTKGAPAVPLSLRQKMHEPGASPAAMTMEPVAYKLKSESGESKAETVAEASQPINEDQTTDAAIDDIVAQEADMVLAAEDAGLERAAALSPELKPVVIPGKRHHPVFWFVIVLLVIVALVTGYLLVNPNY